MSTIHSHIHGHNHMGIYLGDSLNRRWIRPVSRRKTDTATRMLSDHRQDGSRRPVGRKSPWL